MIRKRTFIFLLLLVVVLTFTGCIFTVNKKDSEEDANKESTGVSLGNYLAKITYRSYILSSSGRYFSFELLYDYDYYKQNKTLLTEKMDELKSSFEGRGYRVNIDSYRGEMIAYLNFSTTEAYYKATGYDGFEIKKNDADEVKKSFFYTDYTYRMKTVFEDIDKEYTFIGRILSKGCIEGGIAAKKVLLNYVYGTPYAEKTVNSDADEITYDLSNNLHLHTFVLTTETAQREITLTQHSPNSPAWYLISLLIGIVVCAVPLTILLLKRKRRNR